MEKEDKARRKRGGWRHDVLLKLLVGVVDVELLEEIELEVLKPENVEHTDRVKGLCAFE